MEKHRGYYCLGGKKKRILKLYFENVFSYSGNNAVKNQWPCLCKEKCMCATILASVLIYFPGTNYIAVNWQDVIINYTTGSEVNWQAGPSCDAGNSPTTPV